MDRLAFFKKSLAATVDAVGSIVGLKKAVNALTESIEASLSRIRADIGLQLHSLENEMNLNPEQTLAEVGRIGYTTVETASWHNGTVYGLPPERFREAARKAGLRIAGSHLTRFHDPADERTVMEWWDRALDAQRELGCKYVTMPQLPEFATVDQIAVYGDYFNRIGNKARERGIYFCFHNHDREFGRIENREIFETLAACTDPELVRFELDTFWAHKAGVDIAALLRKYEGRFLLLHIRDFDIVGDSGRIDFDRIVSEGAACGVKDLFVEVRNYTLPPLNCVERSLYNLESLPVFL